MIFACHNLKKMAIWNDRNKKKGYISPLNIPNISQYIYNLLKNLKLCLEKDLGPHILLEITKDGKSINPLNAIDKQINDIKSE